MAHTRNTNTAYASLELRTADAASAERLAAEAYAAGALGLEERETGDGVTLILYVEAAQLAAVQAALAAAVAPADRIGAAAALVETDWSELWKQGLVAIEVSERLRVRPSWIEAPDDGRAELVIDPGQAFGTGGHESTRLALEWVDAVAPELAAGARVLDVGVGTGVLALAALRVADVAGPPAAHASTRAIGFDLDPLAAEAASANAADNGLGARLALFTGPLEALRVRPFDLIVANLLRSELAPLIGGIAARTAPGSRVIVSGLLASECEAVSAAFARLGLQPAGVRERDDASGERWAGLLMRG